MVHDLAVARDYRGYDAGYSVTGRTGGRSDRRGRLCHGLPVVFDHHSAAVQQGMRRVLVSGVGTIASGCTHFPTSCVSLQQDWKDLFFAVVTMVAIVAVVFSSLTAADLLSPFSRGVLTAVMLIGGRPRTHSVCVLLLGVCLRLNRATRLR